MISTQTFRFDKLILEGIDNTPILKINVPEAIEQETCLFHHDVASGNDYFKSLHNEIKRKMSKHEAMPVVRFADGEYAFYQNSLGCNGLYRQAESVEAIKKSNAIAY